MKLRCGRNPIRQFTAKRFPLFYSSPSAENRRAHNERGGNNKLHSTCSISAPPSA